MRQLERELLAALYEAAEVPPPVVGGTQSTAFGGFIGHSRDAHVALTGLRHALYSLFVHPDNRLDGWTPQYEATFVLDVLTWWRARRTAEGWSLEGTSTLPDFARVVRAYQESKMQATGRS